MPYGVEVTDETVMDAVREAVHEGATDLLDGGVPAEEVADRTPLAERTARERLADLATEGRLERVWGVDLASESYEPRLSYLPAGGETGGP